ncbi:MAG: PQQ-binding-like beta-propeller repeat protein [Bacteriovorax sp.]|nr:PQQ-binding-like beta-propeller repeat protein [Bacteriovorax sp.]
MNKILGLLFLVFIISACAQLNPYMPKAEMPKVSKLAPVWIKDLDPLYDSGNLPIALQSPLIHEGIVYIGQNTGSMQAYELENGKPVWSEVDGSTYHAAPISYKDQIVYGTVQGRVISRHYTTGKMKYSVDLGASVETKGVVYQGRIFFQLRNHQVFCLDVETGKILWGYKRSISYLTTLQRASLPVVYKDRVLVGLADGNLVALSIDEGVLLFESKLSTASKFVDIDNAAFILNDKVYLGAVGGPMSLIDPNTGKIIRKADFTASRAPYLIPNDSSEQLLFGTPSGELVLTDKNLNILNKVKISEGVITSIVPFKNGLAVSNTAGEILFVDTKTLVVLEKFHLGHAYSAVFGDMESRENYLSVLSSRNRIFTFH